MYLPGRKLLLFLFTLVLSQCQRSVPPAQLETPKNKNYYVENPDILPLYKAADELEFLRSLIIWKDDRIISEGYFQAYTTDSVDHVRSVTKSVVSILVGIALQEGFIEDINDPISKYLGGKLKNYSPKKQGITIKNLLTMTSGFKWNESKGVQEFNSWVISTDPFHYLFSRELVDAPGHTFDYNSGEPHVLSIIISEASGLTTYEFARKYLFDKLKCGPVRWGKLRDGYYNGGASLQVKPKDLMKIGIMMLNQGNYEGQQIVAKEWVKESFTAQIGVFPKYKLDYGYLWWINNINGEYFYQAKGYGGQYLAINPRQQLVVVVTSQWQNLKGRGDNYIKDLDKVLANGTESLLRIE